jgi:IS6 family transposase
MKKVWMYLYRAVDSEGKTLEFLLSSTQDAEAAKRFFVKALHSSASPVSHTGEIKGRRGVPRVINVDKNAAYPKTIAELKASEILPASVELTPASNT